MKSIIARIALIIVTGLLFNSCKKDTSCEGCKENNKPPIAVAGPDQVVTLPTDSVLLDGSSSSDPDGKISEWLWTKISGPASFNINKSSDSTTNVKALFIGTYLFELKVTDNGGLFAKDTIRIIVDSIVTTNHPPIANAGADQTITLPTNSVNLNGIGSNDPDNNISSYAWTKIAGPSLFNIAIASTVQTQATGLVQGTYQFELKVTDAGGLFSFDTLKVTVNAVSPNNLTPVANAGADNTVNYDLQTCSLNPNSITLNGSASADPDGTIVSYLWTGSGNISNPNSAITQVSNLRVGPNIFTLEVTDNNGATNKDTVIVNVVGTNRPSVPAQLVSFGGLSVARHQAVAAAAGNKILFAGGWIGNPYASGSSFTSRVDIYDITTNTWTTAELSEPRVDIGVAVQGNKIFFAGGTIPVPWGGGGYADGGVRSSRVDIYDASNNTWTTAELSLARGGPAGISCGNKILFGGGSTHFDCTAPTVDIYDTNTNLWSTAALSESREVGSATAVGNKVYFAGGMNKAICDLWFSTSRIDVYDVSSNQWSIQDLNQPRDYMAGIAVDSKNYWAGGSDNTIEIRDAITGNSTFGCLFQPNAKFSASLKNNKMVFFTHDGDYWNGVGSIINKFDIYDITTNTWSIGVLPQNISGSAIISVNNTTYVAGGYVNGVLSNQLWKLEF